MRGAFPNSSALLNGMRVIGLTRYLTEFWVIGLTIAAGWRALRCRRLYRRDMDASVEVVEDTCVLNLPDLPIVGAAEFKARLPRCPCCDWSR